MGEGEPDCDGLSEGEEDMLVGEDQEDHSSGLVEEVLRSAVEEGQGEVEEGQWTCVAQRVVEADGPAPQ